MKTTLNFPDELISLAKIRAVQEKATLTELLVQGLEMRLKRNGVEKTLPFSAASGGLMPGLSWSNLRGAGGEVYR